MTTPTAAEKVSQIEDAIAAGEMNAPKVFTKMREILTAELASLQRERDEFEGQLLAARNMLDVLRTTLRNGAVIRSAEVEGPGGTRVPVQIAIDRIDAILDTARGAGNGRGE